MTKLLSTVGKLELFSKSFNSINFLIVSSLSKQTVSINGERESGSGGGKGRVGGGDGWLSEREDWLLTTTGCASFILTNLLLFTEPLFLQHQSEEGKSLVLSGAGLLCSPGG